MDPVSRNDDEASIVLGVDIRPKCFEPLHVKAVGSIIGMVSVDQEVKAGAEAQECV
jgi:hypothetical protein